MCGQCVCVCMCMCLCVYACRLQYTHHEVIGVSGLYCGCAFKQYIILFNYLCSYQCCEVCDNDSHKSNSGQEQQ
jgi:hypothetical protein